MEKINPDIWSVKIVKLKKYWSVIGFHNNARNSHSDLWNNKRIHNDVIKLFIFARLNWFIPNLKTEFPDLNRNFLNTI